MTRERILIALGILAAAILFLPLRLVAGMADIDGLTARNVSGSIWGGRLHEARLGPVDLGTLDIRLRPLPLLLGRASVAFDRAGEGVIPGIRGIVTRWPGGWSIEQLGGSLGGVAIAGVPIERIEFADAAVAFDGGRCVTASGRATAIVATGIAGLQLPGGLSGTLSCIDGRLRAQFLGQSGLERLILTVDGRGSYVARILVQTGDPVLGAALGGAGFAPGAGGYARTVRGRF